MLYALLGINSEMSPVNSYSPMLNSLQDETEMHVVSHANPIKKDINFLNVLLFIL